METRTAPQWIRDPERRYKRLGRLWMCVAALVWLGFIGWGPFLSLSSFCTPHCTLLNVLAGLCLAGWFVLEYFEPGKRAVRYGAAANALDAAITRYEVAPDRPDSTLSEADQRASEGLRIKPIRTAPAWIRDKRRGYTLRQLGWTSLPFLAVTFPLAASLWRWRWTPWQNVFFAAVFSLLLATAVLGSRRIAAARKILTEAIEGYECVSAENEGVLVETDHKASEVLLSRRGWQMRAIGVLPILAFGGVCRAAPADNLRLCHENAESHPDIAIRACTEAIGSGQLSGADLASASLDRGIAYVAKESYDLAIQDFDQAIRSQPDLAAAFENRCRAYLRKHDDGRALPDCEQAIRLDPKAARPVYGRGVIRFHSGDYDGAMRDFEQAIRLDPQFAMGYAGRASVFGRRGQYDQAIQDYEQALRLSPTSDIYVRRGRLYAQKGDDKSAIRDLDQAIRLNPKFSMAYTSRAYVYGKRGQYDQAIQDCERALRLGPDAEAYRWRGWCYLRKGDYGRAVADFDQAIRLAPNVADTYSVRGYIHSRWREYDQAIADYDHALRLRPSAADYYNRGWAYAQKGDSVSARRDFDQAARLRPATQGRWIWTLLLPAAWLIYKALRRRKAKQVEIDGTGVADTARLSYAEELARKDLDADTEAPLVAASGDQPELVVAQTFASAYDAKLARALLKSANIPTYLADEHAGATEGAWGGPLAGLRLFVPVAFIEQARALLLTRVSDEELAAQAEAGRRGEDLS